MYLIIAIITALLNSCTVSNNIPDPSKIHFDISEIDENGLIGPPDGKRSIAYKFNIPFNSKMKRTVHKIDKSVRFYKKGNSELSYYLCIGEGGTKETILELSGLEFIHKIEPMYWE